MEIRPTKKVCLEAPVAFRLACFGRLKDCELAVGKEEFKKEGEKRKATNGWLMQ